MTQDRTPRGFYYSVTDEQIAAHRSRTIREIFQWLEETNMLIARLQTPEERERTKKIKAGTF